MAVLPTTNYESSADLTDRTYDKLLVKLAEKKFVGVTPELRENIVSFYAQMKTPDQHGIGPR